MPATRVTALAVVAGVALLAVIAWSVASGDFAAEGARLVAMPWGVATLVDAYAGLALFAGWIVYRERRLAAALAWVVGLALTGNLLSCVYVLYALRTANGDAALFWQGAKADAPQRT